MKICVAQTRPFKGEITKNIVSHKRLIELAVKDSADLIVFPELSLTSYESRLAQELATTESDERFADFQTISDAHDIVIAVGMPTHSAAGVQISLIIFAPRQPRESYAKQHLHSDELPYFVGGAAEVFLTVKNKRIAPAICYESLLPEHAEKAARNGANVYLASVAKSAGGIEKGFKHYAGIAEKYSMIVVMSNCLGQCDDFESVGNSAIWNDTGELVGQLDSANEGLLMLDTDTGLVTSRISNDFQRA